MELQTLYTQVMQHLARQGEAAINDEGDCQYRGNNGTRCAVGYLISNEHYQTDFEGSILDQADERIRRAVAKSLGLHFLTDEQAELLSRLQDMHDNCLPHSLGKRMQPVPNALASRLRHINKRWPELITPKVFRVRFGL